MVHSLPTPDQLEERMDRPQPITCHIPNPQCGTSTIPTTTNQQDQNDTPRQGIHLQNGHGTKTHVRKPKHPAALPHFLKSVLRGSITQIPTIPSLGPHDRTQTRHTCSTPWQAYPIITGRTGRTPQICKRTHSKRHHTTIKESIQISVLLH